MVTLAVVGTATSTISEIQSAKQQTKAINNQLAVQQGEIRTAEIAEINDRQRDARREQSRIKVAAGQAGLNIGGSVQALLNDSAMQNSLARERIRTNTDIQQNAALADANGMHARNTRPTLLGAGLKIGLSGANAYYGGKSLQIQKTNAGKGPR